jgi:predicted nucleotidyltransferase component of viral defense system
LARKSNWEALLRIACRLIDQVNSEFQVIDNWTFGGGTALMLHLGHRDSFDVDIFLEDPQTIGFLDPAKSALKFDLQPDTSEGDGLVFQRFVFRELGEIDFIVGAPLTLSPNSGHMIAGRQIALESIGEIITKKVHFRGRSFRPRDVFDVAAAARNHAAEMKAALSPFRSDVEAALRHIENLNPLFVEDALANLNIRPEFSELANKALPTAISFLEEIN